MSSPNFRLALTADAAHPDGTTTFGPIGIELLADRAIEWQVLDADRDPAGVSDLRGYNAILSFGHTVFGADQVDRLPELQLIARFGAGVDSIDLDACTRAGVAVTNTPDGVRRPLALAALTLVLALAHNLPAKDRLVREGRWAERSQYRGHGVDQKVLGIVGFGNVGSDLAELARSLGFTVIGNNRSGSSDRADALGIELVGIEELMAISDYVVLTASLTNESRGMIDARRLALMKNSAYLINVGRGALVDQRALTAALRNGAIAGAGLDVFEPEPLDPHDELASFDSVILTPHSLPHTEEFTRDVARSARDAILATADGRAPEHLLNPEVRSTEAWRVKEATRTGRR